MGTGQGWVRAPWLAGVLLGISWAAGCSGGSAGAALGRPAAPKLLGAEAGDGQVTLRWDAVAEASSYTLYWSLSPDVSKQSGTPVPGVASPYVHQGLANGVTHYYVVAAANAVGEGNASPKAESTPGVPLSPYAPAWWSAVPQQVLELDWNAGKSATQNGADLKAAIAGLQPGQRLELSSGTWSVDSLFSIDRVGTAASPIWIAAQEGASPVITRPDAGQNTINIGANSGARYLALEGLEITGGDTAIKLVDASQVWIQGCHIHDCAGVGIAANTVDTSYLFITQNEIHDTGGTGEGMYLGANYSAVVTHHSVIAQNHVHDTYGSQGDGIELKQGSWANWIVENEIHDTNYPCIIAYGTDGLDPNVIERNLCYRSNDNVMQVQGEAIVRDNLLVDGAQGFQSHDHQGTSMNLTFVHNTIVNTGRGANLEDWGNRPGMVFANNVVYSKSSDAVNFGSGSLGVELAGNVVLGPVWGASQGCVQGSGLSDFMGLAWNASALDAKPSPAGDLIGMADSVWLVSQDLFGDQLVAPFEPGCIDG